MFIGADSATAPTIKAMKEEQSVPFCIKKAITSSWAGKGLPVQQASVYAQPAPEGRKQK